MVKEEISVKTDEKIHLNTRLLFCSCSYGAYPACGSWFPVRKTSYPSEVVVLWGSALSVMLQHHLPVLLQWLVAVSAFKAIMPFVFTTSQWERVFLISIWRIIRLSLFYDVMDREDKESQAQVKVHKNKLG